MWALHYEAPPSALFPLAASLILPCGPFDSEVTDGILQTAIALHFGLTARRTDASKGELGFSRCLLEGRHE